MGSVSFSLTHTGYNVGHAELCKMFADVLLKNKIIERWIIVVNIIIPRDFVFDVTKSYHPVYPNKVFRFLGPGWQVHITNHGPVFSHSQMVAVAVHKHLREVVELGNQFLRKRDVSVFTAD